MASKKYGWLQGALADKGYQQKDLATAWKTDDATVSRFIATGKPDLTIERQLILGQMLGMDPAELLARLTEGLAPRRIIKPSLPVPSNQTRGDVEAVLTGLREALRRVQTALPEAQVSASITYGSGNQ